jgi:hypothetical protein
MKNITSLLAIAVCLAAPAWAQTEIGAASLNGTVSDPTGAVVALAIVKAKSPDTGLVRETETSGAGLYQLKLPVGTYNVSVEAKGFKTAEVKGLNLAVGANLTVNFSLELGAVTETVDVTSESPIVETARTTASTGINSTAVANLPINGRNFLDFTILTPGVIKDPTRGGDLSFGGQRGPANSLMVDGADSNNLFYSQATGRTGLRPYAFSQDAVQEFQVNANSFPAEIGRASGGAINVVTRSGTNGFHGSAFEFYRDKGMNANTFTNNRIGAPKSPYHFNQFGGSLGGPIRKDKILFFINYDQQKNLSTQVMAPNTLPTPAQLPVFQKYLAAYPLGVENKVGLVKTDFNLTDKDRLSVRYNLSRYTGLNAENSGPSSAAEHTGDNEVLTDNVAGVYTRILTYTILESHLNFVKDNEPGYANATAPEVVITNGITFGRNNFSPRYTNTRALQPTTSLSLNRGSHLIKFGFDFNFVRADNYFPGNFGGSYTFPNYQAFIDGTPSRYVQGFSSQGGDVPISHPDVNEWAVFAQDAWRVTQRFTLNYGLRWDYFQYNQPTTKNANAGLLAYGYDTSRIPTQKTNFGPRIGFAYRASKDDRVVIRGGYGVYYMRTAGLLLSTAILQNGIDVLTYTITSGLPTYPNVLASAPGPAAPPDIYVTAPNFATGRTHQASLQVESRVGRNSSVTVGYLGTFGRDLTRTRDVNLAPETAVSGLVCPTPAACSAVDGTPITYFRHNGSTAGIVRPNPAFGRISIFDSRASSNYNGGFVQFVRHFSAGLQVLTSYTYSKVIDTRPDNTSVVSGNSGDDAKVAQDTLNPNADRGPGDADLRHKFVISGVWDINPMNNSASPVMRALLNHWQLSMITQAQSGRPMNVLVTGDPNADGNNFNDRTPGVGRNTLRGYWFTSVDPRLTRDIPLGEHATLKLIAEAFNVTNRANINGVVTTQYSFTAGQFRPTTNYLTTSTVFDPRIFQLAAKIVF